MQELEMNFDTWYNRSLDRNKMYKYILSCGKNFGKTVAGKIGDVAKFAMDAPGKLRKMVQNQLSGKIDDILKQNDLIKKLKK